MDRRTFFTALTGAGLGLGGALGLGAGALQAQSNRQERIGERYPVRVRDGGGAVLLHQMLVTDGTRALVLDWPSGGLLFPEDRVDLSGVPGVGGVFRTPFRRRWVEARPLAPVSMIGQIGLLMARLPDLSGLSGRGVTLGVEDVSWDLSGALRPGNPPMMPRIAARDVGAMRLGADGRVLVHLPQMYALT
ncbi:hypothetical protein C4N9_10680 [Pararhodobacter marinus]|uniref:Uncharacterized protein n=1 Tax=Pararhodobacter marinus TaxID=2184063 RepID=A0A2U2C9A9_9RHOB|nr:hypothetical protein [Pararhodobacter marinus]PWE28457.1 hypothetical protein C4N9_10680 [Pararhodobacter marinus]